jgi:hypothetical protein
MRVGTICEIIPNMICEICLHQWVAIIHTTEIDWDTSIEILFKEDIQCPECYEITPIYREEL